MRQLKRLRNKVMVAILLISMLSIILVSVNAYADTAIKSLTDVKESDWYYETLNNAVSKGIISGYPDGTFKPQNNITRAEFTKMLLNSLDIYISNGSTFQDIEGHWAEYIIYTAWEKDIIRKADFGAEEYEEDVNYYPDTEITRVEIARMAVRALGLEDKAQESIGESTAFTDDSYILDRDKGYVSVAAENGVIKGYEDKTFKPDSEATRAEAAQMIVNMLEARDRIAKEKEEAKANETQEDIIKRVNEKLQNRDVTIKLPRGVKSSAVYENPQTYEELIENVESLKEYNYTGKKGTWEMLDISQVVSNIDYDEFVENYVGVVKMDVPSEGLKLGTSVLDGKTYDILYSNTLLNDGFQTGRLIKDGEVIGRVNKTSSYYGVGLSEEGQILEADYIGFVKDAKNFISSQDSYDRVLIIFENPFKK